jgi:hypothetical protein
MNTLKNNDTGKAAADHAAASLHFAGILGETPKKLQLKSQSFTPTGVKAFGRCLPLEWSAPLRVDSFTRLF